MFSIRLDARRVLFIAAISAAITTPPTLSAEADAADSAEDRQRALIEVLQSDAPPQDKAITCKKLALYGDKDAVPALAALLADEQLASWARIGLEAIPDSEADDALREAMDKLTGRRLVGVINSIARRRDARAVDALVKRLRDTDAEVASAAAVALGHIGNASAATALERSLATAPPLVRSAVAEGCILCAEKYLAQGQSAAAVELYDAVRAADVPKQRILEATRGAILARGEAGAPLLAEQLRAADKDRLAIGLRTARELAGREVTAALVAELRRAAPDRQALLILALGDRNDATVLPAVLEMMEESSEEVRLAAIGVVARLGDATCAAVLLDAALKADANRSQTALSGLANLSTKEVDNLLTDRLSKARGSALTEKLFRTALSGLTDLPGKEVDDVLTDRLSKAQGNARRVLIELAGRRGIAAATPYLLKAADDTDGEIRSAALMALGLTAEFRNLPVLIDRVANPPEAADEAKVAEAALRIACERMPDREACGSRLAAAMTGRPTAVQGKFLEILATMGGARALQAVGAAAQGADPELRDIGSRLLGQWMGPDAAPVLLDLAKTASETKYKVRALRGYIRIPRQFEVPAKERAEMCRAALKIAQRDEERKLVMEVLERYPNMDMLQLALEAAKDPALKKDATRISFVIAQKMGDSDDIQKLLAQLGLRTDVTIGVGGTPRRSSDDGKQWDIIDLPDDLKGLSIVTISRGSTVEPAPAFKFKIREDSDVYIAVHDRGGYVPPKGWEKTDMKLTWSRAETDTVYKRSFKKGEVVVPWHSGTLGSSFGIPNMAFVKDGKVSKCVE